MKTTYRDSQPLKTYFVLGCAVLCAFAVGFVTATSIDAAEDKAPPAYIVVSSKLLKPDAIGPYRDAAGPLARAAGIEIVAGRPDTGFLVLEGDWPYEEGIVIERFKSMQSLKDFWFSEGYQEAKKLREGVSKVNFIVAIEGVPLSED